LLGREASGDLHDVDVVDYDGDALDFLSKLASLAGFLFEVG
jgi:hypothetical protein